MPRACPVRDAHDAGTALAAPLLRVMAPRPSPSLPSHRAEACWVACTTEFPFPAAPYMGAHQSLGEVGAPPRHARRHAPFSAARGTEPGTISRVSGGTPLCLLCRLLHCHRRRHSPIRCASHRVITTTHHHQLHPAKAPPSFQRTARQPHRPQRGCYPGRRGSSATFITASAASIAAAALTFPRCITLSAVVHLVPAARGQAAPHTLSRCPAGSADPACG